MSVVLQANFWPLTDEILWREKGEEVEPNLNEEFALQNIHLFW